MRLCAQRNRWLYVDNYGPTVLFYAIYQFIYNHLLIWIMSYTVEPLFYDHPQNQIGVAVKEGWSSTRGLTIL